MKTHIITLELNCSTKQVPNFSDYRIIDADTGTILYCHRIVLAQHEPFRIIMKLEDMSINEFRTNNFGCFALTVRGLYDNEYYKKYMEKELSFEQILNSYDFARMILNPHLLDEIVLLMSDIKIVENLDKAHIIFDRGSFNRDVIINHRLKTLYHATYSYLMMYMTDSTINCDRSKIPEVLKYPIFDYAFKWIKYRLMLLSGLYSIDVVIKEHDAFFFDSMISIRDVVIRDYKFARIIHSIRKHVISTVTYFKNLLLGDFYVPRTDDTWKFKRKIEMDINGTHFKFTSLKYYKMLGITCASDRIQFDGGFSPCESVHHLTIVRQVKFDENNDWFVTDNGKFADINSTDNLLHPKDSDNFDNSFIYCDPQISNKDGIRYRKITSITYHGKGYTCENINQVKWVVYSYITF